MTGDSSSHLVGNALLLVAGVGPAVLSTYLGVVGVAALTRRHRGRANPRSAATSRIVVLVPAHNEADFIARCVGSLRAQTYPAALFEIVVIADNCTDTTATIAERAGATVLVRDMPDQRGKGQALRWATEQLLARDYPPDGIVVVDADATAEPDFLERLALPLAEGAEAVQGESLLSDDGSQAGALRAAAFLLINRARPMGRAALGIPCNLAGNGMLLSTRLLRKHPWDAFTAAEDLEYSVNIRLAGVKPVFAPRAVLRSPVITDDAAAERQRLRWEGGKFHVARTAIPRFLRQGWCGRQPWMLEAALDLAVPPLGLLAGATGFGTAVAAVVVALHQADPWALVPWLVAAAGIPVFTITGLIAADAPRSAYRALLGAPRFVVRKVARTKNLLGFRADTWVRGQRPSDPGAAPAEN